MAGMYGETITYKERFQTPWKIKDIVSKRIATFIPDVLYGIWDPASLSSIAGRYLSVP